MKNQYRVIEQTYDGVLNSLKRRPGKTFVIVVCVVILLVIYYFLSSYMSGLGSRFSENSEPPTSSPVTESTASNIETNTAIVNGTNTGMVVGKIVNVNSSAQYYASTSISGSHAVVSVSSTPGILPEKLCVRIETDVEVLSLRQVYAPGRNGDRQHKMCFIPAGKQEVINYYLASDPTYFRAVVED